MLFRRFPLSTSALLFLLLVPATPALSSPNSHDGGFFLRLSAGAGIASTELSEGGDEFKIDGPSGDLNLAVGAVVVPNLAIHATLFGWFMSEPDAEFNGEKGTLEEDVGLSAIGAGITYYIDPANVYLSSSVGAGELSVEGDNFTITTDKGIVVDITVGKEWWVGQSWGIGVAGAAVLHSIPDGDVDGNWSGPGFAVRFTATMN